MTNLKSVLTTLLLAFSATAFSQKGITMEVWPNGAPNANGDDKDKAELTVYLPDAKKATGRAIVCCPGGGYSHLAMDHEGHQWATFFNNQGIALIVLKYRMPHGNYVVPISDAEQAMKIVRQNAAEWHIDTHNVGIMGFSAGGHLASTIATHSKGDAAPDFQILFYPVITMDLGFTQTERHLVLSLHFQTMIRPYLQLMVSDTINSYINTMCRLLSIFILQADMDGAIVRALLIIIKWYSN